MTGHARVKHVPRILIQAATPYFAGGYFLVFETLFLIKSLSMQQTAPARIRKHSQNVQNSDFAVALDFRIKRVISTAQDLKTDQIRAARETFLTSRVQSCKACKSFDPHKIN
jgi:hypothetical protein